MLVDTLDVATPEAMFYLTTQESLLSTCAIFVILAIDPKLQLNVKHKFAGWH